MPRPSSRPISRRPPGQLRAAEQVQLVAALDDGGDDRVHGLAVEVGRVGRGRDPGHPVDVVEDLLALRLLAGEAHAHAQRG